jgi:hypothetical protein
MYAALRLLDSHCKNRGGPLVTLANNKHKRKHTAGQCGARLPGHAHLVTCFSRPALASMECLDEGAALLNRRHLVGLQRIDLRT